MQEQELVIGLDRDLKARLEALAAEHGVTLEEMMRMILHEAINQGIDRAVFGERERG